MEATATTTKKSAINLMFPELKPDDVFLEGNVRVLSVGPESTHCVVFTHYGQMLRSDKMTFFEMLAQGKPLTAVVQMPVLALVEHHQRSAIEVEGKLRAVRALHRDAAPHRDGAGRVLENRGGAMTRCNCNYCRQRRRNDAVELAVFLPLFFLVFVVLPALVLSGGDLSLWLKP